MNSFQKLRQRDNQIVRECLKAAVEGPFFPDWEFQTLFGVEREDVAEIVKSWANVDLRNLDITNIIRSTLNNLVGYPHGKDADWDRYISASPEEVARLLDNYLSKGSN